MPAKGLFALPFMRRAQEKRRAQAQAEAAAMLRDMEAADAGADLDSSDEAANWAAAEPVAGRGSRLRFGGGLQQQHSQLVSSAMWDDLSGHHTLSLTSQTAELRQCMGHVHVGTVFDVTCKCLALLCRDPTSCIKQECIGGVL